MGDFRPTEEVVKRPCRDTPLCIAKKPASLRAFLLFKSILTNQLIITYEKLTSIYMTTKSSVGLI